MDKTVQTYSWLGNIASATIPVNYTMLAEAGKLKQDTKLFILSAGSGISASQMGIALIMPSTIGRSSGLDMKGLIDNYNC